MFKHFSLFRCLKLSSTNIFYRKFAWNRPNYNYDGPGRTTTSFLNDDIGKFLIIDSVNDEGFWLSNGAYAQGPIILFPSFVFSWKVSTIDDITPQSLNIFRMIEPKIELLLIGIGLPNYWSIKSLQTLKQNMKKMTDLRIELLPTKAAVATYNFMLSDFRLVAGAFLPFANEIDLKFLEAK